MSKNSAVRKAAADDLVLRDAEERLGPAFVHAPIGMAVTALDGRVLRVNDSLCRHLGWSEEELTGQSFIELVGEEGRKDEEGCYRALRRGESDASFVEQRFRHGAGKAVWLRVMHTLMTANGRTPYVFVQAQDVTLKRAADQHIVDQLFHDPLTGLANRLLFTDRLTHALHAGQRTTASVAVLFLDLDRFKAVNDSLGHAAGDRVLIEVAKRLTAVVRPGDTVARFGGDEFAIICETITEQNQVAHIAERITAAVAEPISIDGAELVLGASVGVAFDTTQESAAVLVRNADRAMYRAKKDGRGRHQLFTPALQDETSRRLELEEALRRGLGTQFRLVYQPLIDLRDRHVTGVEALVRWDHPDLGLMTPDSFIPLAEETGLIVPIGEFVLADACLQAAHWQRGGAKLEVAVNLSIRQLVDAGIIDAVQRALDDSGLDPSLLCLEITETVLMDAVGSAMAALRTLKDDVGIRVAIDDFGTGYSSLGYLQDLPVDVLKLDQRFVSGGQANVRGRMVTSAVIGLADKLDLGLVAEGIETAEQLAFLQAEHCPGGQGFYFSQPLTPQELEPLLTAGRQLP